MFEVSVQPSAEKKSPPVPLRVYCSMTSELAFQAYTVDISGAFGAKAGVEETTFFSLYFRTTQ